MPTSQHGLHLFHRLKRLGTIATVLHVGAHPDDEDIGLLVYVSRKLGGRAVYWSATRGEGGQNIINSYRGEALGLFRTWESLAAREIDGGECLFGPFVDFGFSKDAQDAFIKWDRKEMVQEVVRAIRLVQPQVVVSCWSGGPKDGHGHHQAVGQAVLEAFDAAGDPGSFPEQISAGLAPWRPMKLYRSDPSMKSIMGAGKDLALLGREEQRLERDGVLRINTGEYDPVDGLTFQERAWIAMNRHQTQGLGFTPRPGDFYYYFHLVKTNVETPPREQDFFDGLDPTLTGLAEIAGDLDPGMRGSLERVKERVNDALRVLRADDPVESSHALLDGLSLLRSLKENLEKMGSQDHLARAIAANLGRKEREFERVIARCLGLRLEVLATRRKLTPGESAWVSARLWNHRNITVKEAVFSVQAPEKWRVVPQEDLAEHDERGRITEVYEVFAGQDASLSCPYWLEEPGARYTYTWPDKDLVQQPLSPAPVNVECRVFLENHHITMRGPAVRRKAFQGFYRELPLAVLPPISLHPESDKRFLLTGDCEQRLELTVVARCNDDERPAKGLLELDVPPDWPISPFGMNIQLEQGGGALEGEFTVTVPAGSAEGRYELNYKINCRNREYGVVLTPVRMSAPGIPAQGDEATSIKEEFLLSPSRITVHLIDASFIEGPRYGYVEGAKEEVPAILKSVGVDFQPISDHEIAHHDLSTFDAIVVGPNAYLVREELREYGFRLIEYVESGGTLIVQYQGYGYQAPGLAPYPFKYNHPHDRVTQEQAPIEILRPQSPIFRFPNPIGPEDFEGWIHDRGLYFFGQWDDRYTTYLASRDPGEAPKEGGLVGCRYGEGNYIYVGYSLFRQLPAGVPGAFRVFANLLALPDAPDSQKGF